MGGCSSTHWNSRRDSHQGRISNMSEESIGSEHWSRAANLKERAFSIGSERDPRYDLVVAQRRLAQWHSQVPFQSDGFLRRRLAAVGLTEEQFLCILGEPIEVLERRLEEPFVEDIQKAFDGHANGADSGVLPLSIMEQIHGSLVRPFEPLLRLANQRLGVRIRSLLGQYPKPPFEVSEIGEILLPSLVHKFSQIVSRTLVLELNVARMEERLVGQTPQERFDCFLQLSSRRDETLRILSEYPVLARQLLVAAELWLDASVEFLRNLCADWSAIRDAFFGGQDPGILTAVSNDAGDSHRGGRSVRIARFASGLPVVYKPRSLAIDVHFQELLGWLNDHGAQPRLPLLTVLDEGDHGWQEFVAPGPCTSSEAVSRFYARQGAYLALLYALAATDFHFENLIAAGENPFLIDLEAVFHPRLQDFNPSEAEHTAASELHASVVATGLLPHRMGSKPQSEGLDLSGLGGAGGQLLPWESPYAEETGTDRMHFTRKSLTTIEGANRPTLDGKPVDLLDYQPALVGGFTRTYRLLLAHRNELLSGQGPLQRMSNDEVRVVLRPTRIYGQLLFESYHPDVLCDALDRDRLFDRLWVAAPLVPHLEQVIAGEHEDLWRGDIPIFTTRPGSRDLWHAGHDRVAGFLREPSINGHRLAQLSEADLARQLWFIDASLTNLSGATRRTRSAKADGGRYSEPVSHDDLLIAACACGDRLVSLAYRGDENASWLGLNYIDERQPKLVPIGMDLYEGLCGITLFLAYLGEITRESRYSELARAALATVERHLEKEDSALSCVGGFGGWGGVIYTLASLSALWGDPALLAKAQATVEWLPVLIDEDTHLDMIGGSAGCISALLALDAARPSDRALAAAVQCGERLLGRSRPMNPGIGWLTIGQPQPLGGVSHGASGFALALFSLFGATRETRFRTAGLQAIDYERSLFRKEAGNWLDLRQLAIAPGGGGERRDRFATAWCHGAPGIGLTRLKLLPYLKEDPDIYQEIQTALDTTVIQGFAGDHSLCHGDMGNLEVLLEASQTLEAPRWRHELSRFTAATLESIQRDGWICGVPQGVEVPGLMTGLAGIGYELLRLAEPHVVPSVLSFETPRDARPGPGVA
jgi:type 2 lantibiotic biosynthesis protein LanM